MNVENWIEVSKIGIDLLKTIIPFGVLLIILWWFQKEIRTLIKNGGFKVTGPGVSIETIQKQQEKVGTKEKKEIETLNTELETTKKAEQKLQELQEYTNRDKDTFFLGYHFEKTYRLIFPSQMVVLNIMNNSNNEISDALAHSLFTRTIWAQQQYNLPYDQFMGFLANSGLIEYNSESKKWLLTPLGRTFWEYLTNNHIHLKIPASDVVDKTPI